MSLLKVKLDSGFESQKLTLKEAQDELGISDLRDLRLKHPQELKVIFKDWNDTATSFTWRVYRGDLARLQEVVEKISPGTVKLIQPNTSTYTYKSIGKKVGRSSHAIALLFRRSPHLFTCIKMRGAKKIFDHHTLDKIIAHSGCRDLAYSTR